MITREQIPSVLDHAVYDTQGNKIGDAKHIFLDDVSGRPEWASVKTGMFGARESFVPIREATLVEDHMEVPYDKAMVKEAPTVAVDSGGHLSAEEEHRLYEYYGVDWDTAWQQPGRPGEGRAAPAGEMGPLEEEMGLIEEGGAAGTTGAEGRAMPAAEEPTREPAGRPGMGPDEERMPRGKGRTDTGAARLPGTAGERAAGAGPQGAMTRSEEHMYVSTERREVGRAKLRKYVVTEQEEQQVPLMHEEVRVEREPITEQNRAQAMTGPAISEGQHEVTLHADRPVIETRTEPVERVRLDVEERTERETVRGEVRKEKIDVELPEETGPDTGTGLSGGGDETGPGGR